MKQHSQIPQLAQRITRHNLHEKLEAASDYGVLLVSAPPGYGKTTAVVQLLEHTERPIIWHTLDARDRDSFVLDNRCRTRISSYLNYAIPQPQYLSDGQQLATELTDHIQASVQSEFTLVLDDVHQLDGSPSAEMWLRAFVSKRPASCRIILISRTIPALPFAQLLTYDQVKTITKDDLALTQDDAPSLHAAFPHETEAQILQKIHHFGGWVTGVMLSLRPIPALLEAHFDEDRLEEVFYTMAGDLLHQQSPVIQQFLLQSSVLPVFTADLCERVLGLTECGQALATVLQNNLFIDEVTGGYRYHPLFKDFLQARLKQDFPGRYQQLHQVVAEWWSAQYEPEMAFEHYIAGDDITSAVELTEHIAHTYFIQGRYDTLRHFYQQLSAYTLPTPNLHLVVGIHHLMHYRYTQASQAFDSAEHDFTLQGQLDMLPEIEIQRARLLYQQREYKLAVTKLENVLADANLPDNLHGHALHVMGECYRSSGETEQAIDTLEAALDIYEIVNDDLATSSVLQDLQIAYMDGGYVDNSEDALNHLVTLRRQIGNPSQLAIALNNLGYFYYICGDYHRADEVFEEGLSLARSAYHIRFTALLLWSRGDLLRDQKQFKRAHQAYREAIDLLEERDPSLALQILFSNITLHRWWGMQPEGAALAEKALHLADKYNLHAEASLAALHRLLCQVDGANDLASIESFEALIGENEAREPALATIARTIVAMQMNNEYSALSLLEDAYHIAVDAQNLQPLAAEVTHSPALYAIARANKDQFQNLWDRVQQIEEPSHRAVQATYQPIDTSVHRLQVNVLGGLQVLRDGHEITSKQWRSKQSRDLFLLLLLHGPAHRETISALFWPDLPAKKVRSNFHTTLHRARVAVGDKTIIFEDDIYRINPDVHIECDAHRFKILIREARLLAPRTARAADLWLNAAQLYKGRLLPNCYASWVIDLQHEYKQLAVDVAIHLGDCARARRAVDEAIQHYRAALREAPHREDIYRRMLATFAGAGRRGEIVQLWRSIQKIFKDELQTTPSPQTKQLVTDLLT